MNRYVRAGSRKGSRLRWSGAMRLGVVLAFGLGLVLAAALPFVPTATAQVDRVTCGFFETQEDAQAYLDSGQGDPAILDGDGDGIACEEAFEVPGAEPDPVTCGHFEDQEGAQWYLDSGAGDPALLDPDGDGIACEDFFNPPGGPPAVDYMTCGAFETQEDAQEYLDSGLGDPELLDADGNGIACEHRWGTPTTPPTTGGSPGGTVALPNTGAGWGASADAFSAAWLVLSLLAAGCALMAGIRLRLMGR